MKIIKCNDRSNCFNGRKKHLSRIFSSVSSLYISLNGWIYLIFQNTNIQNTEYKPLNLHFHQNTITHCKLYSRRDSCTNSKKILSHTKSCIKGEKKTLTQNKGRIFKGCGNKGAVLRCTGSVVCIIEKEYKKKKKKRF